MRRQPMEITNKSQAISIDAYVKQVQAPPKTEPAGEKDDQPQGLKTDTVVISDTRPGVSRRLRNRSRPFRT